VLCFRVFSCFGSSVGCKIDSAAGCVGLGDKEGREKDLWLSAQIELYIFIYSINKHSSVDVSLGRG
jgi:hypothetical protein